MSKYKAYYKMQNILPLDLTFLSSSKNDIVCDMSALIKAGAIIISYIHHPQLETCKERDSDIKVLYAKKRMQTKGRSTGIPYSVLSTNDSLMREACNKIPKVIGIDNSMSDTYLIDSRSSIEILNDFNNENNRKARNTVYWMLLLMMQRNIGLKKAKGVLSNLGEKDYKALGCKMTSTEEAYLEQLFNDSFITPEHAWRKYKSVAHLIFALVIFQTERRNFANPIDLEFFVLYANHVQQFLLNLAPSKHASKSNMNHGKRISPILEKDLWLLPDFDTSFSRQEQLSFELPPLHSALEKIISKHRN